MILNERVLRIIVTLAEELHFGRAAAVLYVSQPALSGQVKSLERDLGVRLFVRTSRHVELTDAGRVFVSEARRLMKEGERAVALVRGSTSDVLGPLRIGYPASLNIRWLCSLISRLRQDRLPTPDLQFVSAEATDLHEGLMKGTLHVAFFAGQVCHPDLQSVQILRESASVAIHASHPLARCTALMLERLKDEPVVWLRRDLNPLFYDGFLALCSSQGYHPKIVQEVRSFSECAEFVRAALGITFLPSSMKEHYQRDPILFRRLFHDTLHMELTLTYRRGAGSSTIERFVELVQEYIAREEQMQLHEVSR